MPEATIHHAGGRQTAGFEPGATLAEILNQNGFATAQPCGGQGSCGACRVQAAGQLSPPGATEQKTLGAEALAAGWRLACQARAEGNVTLTATEGPEVLRIETAGEDVPAEQPLYRRAGLAVDIGTTTLAARLCLPDGRGFSAAAQNPQTRFGADVLTRIRLSLEGQGEALALAVREGLAALLRTLAAEAGIAPAEVDAFVVTANTAMLYLLCGYNPRALAAAPFAADHLFGKWLPAATLIPGAGGEARCYLPRCVSAFVGADITTAALACNLPGQPGNALLADIGTNGELMLSQNGVLSCCSTAAGPCFEGVGMACGMLAASGAVDRLWAEAGALQYSTIGKAPPRGICGSGILDAVALLLAEDIVDETGAFKSEGHGHEAWLAPHAGRPALHLAEGVALTDEDVRGVQLAKGAIRAGIETLLHHAGLGPNGVGRLFIAGGFGRHLRLESAAAIGLIPPALAPRARAVGNAALKGAVMLLQNEAALPQSEALAKNATTLELGPDPVFQEYYMEHMGFDEEG